MICFMDSYEWVMVPNVMGMSQFSLESISMMTRPYFSSSAYILRMSDFKSNPIKIGLETYEWKYIWNSLYYRFLHKNKQRFAKIYAIANQVKNLNNLDIEILNQMLKVSNKYIEYGGY